MRIIMHAQSVGPLAAHQFLEGLFVILISLERDHHILEIIVAHFGHPKSGVHFVCRESQILVHHERSGAVVCLTQLDRCHRHSAQSLLSLSRRCQQSKQSKMSAIRADTQLATEGDTLLFTYFTIKTLLYYITNTLYFTTINSNRNFGRTPHRTRDVRRGQCSHKC